MEWITIVCQVLVGALFLVILIGLLHCFWRDNGHRKQTVKATLMQKQSSAYHAFTQYGALGQADRDDLILVFDVGGKRRPFMVDALLYDRVREGQSGTLVYQDSRLIDFN